MRKFGLGLLALLVVAAFLFLGKRSQGPGQVQKDTEVSSEEKDSPYVLVAQEASLPTQNPSLSSSSPDEAERPKSDPVAAQSAGLQGPDKQERKYNFDPKDPANAEMLEKALLPQIRESAKQKDVAQLLTYLKPGYSTVILDVTMESLTELGATEAIPQIASFADTNDDILQAQVLKSLGTLGGMSKDKEKLQAFETLQAMYRRFDKEKNPKLSVANLANAVDAVSMVNHPRAVDFLLQELSQKSGNLVLQAYIARALGRMGDTRALPALLELRNRYPRLPNPKGVQQLEADSLAQALEKSVSVLEAEPMP